MKRRATNDGQSQAKADVQQVKRGIAPIGRDVDYQRMARRDNGICTQPKRQ